MVKSGLFEMESRMDQNTFVDEFKAAVAEMVPITIVSSEVDDGVLRKGTIDMLGTEIVLVAIKNRLRECLIVRKIESMDPNAPKQKVNPKYPQSLERKIHTDDAWSLVENASEQLMDAIQRLILPPSQEELARRKSFRNELVAKQKAALSDFSPEDQTLITNLLSRPENRGYGKTHWGGYAVEALVFLGSKRVVGMADKTFQALEGLCLGQGMFGAFHRAKNNTTNQVEDGLSPNALWIAKNTRTSGIGALINDLDAEFKAMDYKPGITAYGIEIIYKVVRAIKDRNAAAIEDKPKAVDTSKDLVIKLAPKPQVVETPVAPVVLPPVLSLDEQTDLLEATQTSSDPAQVVEAAAV